MILMKALIDDSKHKAARRPRISPPLAEWADVRGVEKLFGIKETSLYQLIREGKVRSILIKKQGKARGKRLVSLDSIRQLLSSMEAK
jgi:hypothetical protein